MLPEGIDPVEALIHERIQADTEEGLM